MCSFDGADLGTNSDVLVSFPVRCRNVCGMFVERLLLYCFDITISNPSSRLKEEKIRKTCCLYFIMYGKRGVQQL